MDREEGVPDELLLPLEDGRWIIRGELEPALRERLLAERARGRSPSATTR